MARRWAFPWRFPGAIQGAIQGAIREASPGGACPRTSRGLDWLFFFVADLQTGFGPFIAVYLTRNRWTQAELGLALGIGSVSAMLAQVPAGMLVDATPRKAIAAG